MYKIANAVDPKRTIHEQEPKKSVWVKNDTVEKENNSSKECCSCEKKILGVTDDIEVERRIGFEDYLINSVYVKRFDC